LTDADDLSDSSETGWEWLAALSQKTSKPLPPMQSLSGFNPLFRGDIARAPSPSSQSFRRSQSFNPVFKAEHAQHEQLEVDSNAWQLHGMVANPRTSPQEMSSLAWDHSASSSSIVAVPAPTAEAEPRLTTDGAAAEEDALADSMARLLAGDRQDSADWVSSSSSSDDVSPPVRSLSLPSSEPWLSFCGRCWHSNNAAAAGAVVPGEAGHFLRICPGVCHHAMQLPGV
jgi:hypothetical protein